MSRQSLEWLQVASSTIDFSVCYIWQTSDHFFVVFVRSTPPSRHYKAELSRSQASIRPQKVFLMNEIWYVGRGRWVIHDGILYDPIQGQGQGQGHKGRNMWKWSISKPISPANMHVIKRLMVTYDIPKQYLNFYRTDFWYSSSFGIMWPSNLGCCTFGKWILPLSRSRPAVLYGASLFHGSSKQVLML